MDALTRVGADRVMVDRIVEVTCETEEEEDVVICSVVEVEVDVDDVEVDVVEVVDSVEVVLT